MNLLEKMLADNPKRFPAYLRANFDAFTKIIERLGADWDVIAAWAEKQGLTGGKPMKPASAKRAYDREATRLKAAAKSQPKPQPAPVRQETPVDEVSPPNPKLDDLAASMDAGRGWIPKPRRRS